VGGQPYRSAGRPPRLPPYREDLGLAGRLDCHPARRATASQRDGADFALGLTLHCLIIILSSWVSKSHHFSVFFVFSHRLHRNLQPSLGVHWSARQARGYATGGVARASLTVCHGFACTGKHLGGIAMAPLPLGHRQGKVAAQVAPLQGLVQKSPRRNRSAP
jgi:hypothetical protein